MNMFELLHQTAGSDTDLLRENDRLGDMFTIARKTDFAFETGARNWGSPNLYSCLRAPSSISRSRSPNQNSSVDGEPATWFCGQAR